MSANPVYMSQALALDEHQLSEEAILVRNTLIEHGLETPMIDTGLSAEEKYQRIKFLMSEVVETLGLDLTDDSLAETPHRIAKMYVHEIFSGLDYRHFPKLSLIENKMGADEMVKIREIDLTSTCEHHFVTIDGRRKSRLHTEGQNHRPVENQPHRAFLWPAPAGAGAPDPANPGGPAGTAGNRRCRRQH